MPSAARATRICPFGFLLARGLVADGVGAGVVFITLTPMSEKLTRYEATQRWLRDFSEVPGSIFRKLVNTDLAILTYESSTLTLVASPQIECTVCGDREPRPSEHSGATVTRRCDTCHGDTYWRLGGPELDFPCGWETLFSPNREVDREWILANKDEISSRLDIYVFESDDYGVLLGIDGGGYDFNEAHWLPLYELWRLR